MSDEKAEQVTLTPEDISKFFSKVGANKPCPFCGSEAWRVPGGGEILSNAMPWANAEGEMYMNGIPLFMMVCARCNFVRSHAFSPSYVKSVVDGPSDGN